LAGWGSNCLIYARGLLVVWQGNFAEFMVRKSSSFLPLLAFTRYFWVGVLVGKVTLSGEGIQTLNTYYQERLSNYEANYASSC
jgi:hypothetical protein